MNAVSRQTRRRNLVTFVLLALFAVGLCAYVLVSMRIHNQREQQRERAGAPPSSTTFWPQSRLSFAA